jgi:hypothetical protein
MKFDRGVLGISVVSHKTPRVHERDQYYVGCIEWLKKTSRTKDNYNLEGIVEEYPSTWNSQKNQGEVRRAEGAEGIRPTPSCSPPRPNCPQGTSVRANPEDTLRWRPVASQEVVVCCLCLHCVREYPSTRTSYLRPYCTRSVYGIYVLTARAPFTEIIGFFLNEPKVQVSCATTTPSSASPAGKRATWSSGRRESYVSNAFKKLEEDRSGPRAGNHGPLGYSSVFVVGEVAAGAVTWVRRTAEFWGSGNMCSPWFSVDRATVTTSYRMRDPRAPSGAQGGPARTWDQITSTYERIPNGIRSWGGVGNRAAYTQPFGFPSLTIELGRAAAAIAERIIKRRSSGQLLDCCVSGH